jgi:ubiquinol-cytochrome c reductase cytochrome c1 subunit
MRKLVLTLILCLPSLVFANTAGPVLQKANTNVHDKAAVIDGAKLYFNYCAGCHSLKYARYQRFAQDMGLTDEQLKENFMFAAEKPGELITIGMPAADSKAWFGVTPPDLSVTGRSRGSDWLYTYLLSFYVDEAKNSGVNNLLFKDVAMPHALWELQGWQKPVYKTVKGEDGHEHQALVGLELVDKDKMSEAEYKKKVEDYELSARNLTTFLEYMAEPAKLKRERLGIWVLAFLFFIMLPVTYLLKKEYWRDVH